MRRCWGPSRRSSQAPWRLSWSRRSSDQKGFDEESVGMWSGWLHLESPRSAAQARRTLGPRGGSQSPRVRADCGGRFSPARLARPGRVRRCLDARLRDLRRRVPVGGRHGRHGVHPLGRVDDHAEQRADQPQHDRRRGRKGIKRYFFSSSVCIYRDMRPGEPELKEDEAYPALPDNEYGWEKLYAERVAMAYGRKHGMEVRIARFQNGYGTEGTWTGGREKAA